MRTLSALLVAAVVLVTGACGSTTPYAAKVNGDTITQAELNREMRAILDNEKYLEFVESQAAEGGGAESVLGKGDKTLSSAYVATLLNGRIAGLLVRQELERLDLAPTEAQLKVAEERYHQQLGTLAAQEGKSEREALAEGKRIFESLPAGYRQYLVAQLADFDVFSEHLQETAADDEAIQEYYEEHEEEFAETCVSHILVDTEAEADDIHRRLEAGEDFAAIAAASSKDNQGPSGGSAAEGGSLGCLTAGEAASFIEPFRVAMDGLDADELSEPVQTEFGYHVIKVTERRSRPLDDATKQAIGEQLGDGNARIRELVADAKIEVNPRYGTFEKETKDQPLRGVVPPDVPSTTTTLDPSAPIAPGGAPLQPTPEG